MEPLVGIEPTTYSLRVNCSTPELQWRADLQQRETLTASHPYEQAETIASTRLSRSLLVASTPSSMPLAWRALSHFPSQIVRMGRVSGWAAPAHEEGLAPPGSAGMLPAPSCWGQILPHGHSCPSRQVSLPPRSSGAGRIPSTSTSTSTSTPTPTPTPTAPEGRPAGADRKRGGEENVNNISEAASVSPLQLST
jgi:hypothetical protein